MLLEFTKKLALEIRFGLPTSDPCVVVSKHPPNLSELDEKSPLLKILFFGPEYGKIRLLP